MQIIRICDNDGLVKGEMDLLENGDISYRAGDNQKVNELVGSALSNGLPDHASIYDTATKQMVHRQVVAEKTDEAFMHALSLLLGRAGYRMVEDDSLEDIEIRKILGSYPLNNPDKQDILLRLIGMSKLEKTLLLSELRTERFE